MVMIEHGKIHAVDQFLCVPRSLAATERDIDITGIAATSRIRSRTLSRTLPVDQ